MHSVTKKSYSLVNTRSPLRPGYRTLFITAQGLITALARAHAENRLDDKLKFYCQPKLLIIDEIGYIPIDRLGANLFSNSSRGLHGTGC
jgi:DNA replication protein DnaC